MCFEMGVGIFHDNSPGFLENGEEAWICNLDLNNSAIANVHSFGFTEFGGYRMMNKEIREI